MSKYHILEGTNVSGPFTVVELREKALSPNALIWGTDLGDWTKISKTDIGRELFVGPPPPPKKAIALNFFKGYRWLIVWSIAHLMLLGSSYGNLLSANAVGSHRETSLWPVSVFTYSEWVRERGFHFSPQSCIEQAAYELGVVVECLDAQGRKVRTSRLGLLDVRYRSYEGFLVDYDWSEFVSYMFIPWIFVVLRRRKSSLHRDQAESKTGPS